MRHIDLFTGIGGFSLAADWTWGDECEHVCFVEIDKFCQRVLKKHWPNVPCVEDVNNVEQIAAYAGCQRQERTGEQTERLEERDDGIAAYAESTRQLREKQLENYCRCEHRGEIPDDAIKKSSLSRIDLLTGGVPCQPASCAGQRKGREDHRWLWPQALAVVDRLKPRYVLFENPTGFLTLNKGVEYEAVLAHLEAQGYWVESFILPASAAGAPHRRDRVWICARLATNSDRGMRNGGQHQQEREAQGGAAASGTDSHAPDSESGNGTRELQEQGGRFGTGKERMPNRGCGWDEHWFQALARIYAFHDGLPGRLVVSRQPRGWRVNALKAVGNSVCVQVVHQIMLAIKEADEHATREETNATRP